MNDHYLDPPEEQEPPTCPRRGCDGLARLLGERKGAFVFVCEECGKTFSVKKPVEREPEEDPTVEDQRDMEAIHEEQASKLCPHGKPAHECNHCLHAADLAFDAARERRAFGR